MNWYDDPKVIKQQDFLLLRVALISRVPEKGAISSYTLIKLVHDETDFGRDDINYMYWLMVGEGKLIRVNDGVMRGDTDWLNFSFTTISTKTKGIYK